MSIIENLFRPLSRGAAARPRPAARRTAAFTLLLQATAGLSAFSGSAVTMPQQPEAPAPAPPRPPEPVVFPTGTLLPIRFLSRLVGGRDTVGTPVLVQTLGALTRDSCVVVEPYTEVRGRVVESHQGGRFGRPGALEIAWDTITTGPDQVTAISAALDSLEYVRPAQLSDSGAISGGMSPRAFRFVKTGALVGVGALTEEITAVPVAVLAGWHLVRRGARPRILPGEVARLRLTSPLTVMRTGACLRTDAHPDLTQLPELPAFHARTSDDREGRRLGDPVNLVFLGSSAALDSAFHQAGWVTAERPGLRSLARGVTAAVVERPAVGAPVSTQYFEGRKQDMAFELSGPNARFRHHLRLWQMEGAPDVWVGSADQDIGLVVKPFRRSATHRIAPDVDLERDLIVQVLEATGCSDLLAYRDMPDAVTSGRNASGQRFNTDGRVALVRMKPCR